jgi:uncharacterized linocin/CFP29 family protein
VSVASAFLPCYGPLPPSAEYVKDEKLETVNDGALVKVEDDTTVQLFNLTVKVQLSREQVFDEGLSSALLAFRRAANTLAQVEDDIIFNGFARAADAANVTQDRIGTSLRADLGGVSSNETTKVAVSGPAASRGLDREIPPEFKPFHAVAGNTRAALLAQGEEVVSAVVTAIGFLEDHSHPGPFACILGKGLFVAVHTAGDGLVLPADRITPLLNGPLLRSGKMRDKHGLVVSLANNSIDVVVATPPTAQFLQVTEDAKFLFRVYERFVLRMKDKTVPAVYVFDITPPRRPR